MSKTQSFLDSITPDGVTDIINGVQKLGNTVTFGAFATDLDEQNKSIANHLLSEGITAEQIQHFVDVSRVELDPYLEQRTQFLAWKAEEATIKPKAK